MGHIIFIFLHLLAVVFGLVGLILTIPLHLIYSAVLRGPKPKREISATDPGTKNCKYCGHSNFASNTHCIACGSEV